MPEASKQNTPLFCTVHHVSPFSPCAIDETLLPMMYFCAEKLQLLKACWRWLIRYRPLFSSPPGTKMFQFPGFSSLKLCIGLRMITHFLVIGFPHSDTPGSLNVYFSPRRFAVFCVLLLLYMPRHPPYALLHLITLLENF